MESTMKLCSFVTSNYIWYSEAIHDVLVKALCNGCHCFIYKGKGFNPFGIFVYANKDGLFPPLSFWM